MIQCPPGFFRTSSESIQTELSLKVAIKAIDHHTRAGYAKEHPDLISAFMTTAAANFATLTEREIAEAEQVTTINVKTGEVES
ncbi:hypothetical protein [Escherichia coli]|uniref:hypothetical protein n=1 Tax=Escherichia coli TaxID=562 RepID=UPI0032DA9020